ncbi:(Fe-S)-binding protein, partial [bacterium]|nr:(Fe-S)-binding protein [bacterium]
KYFGQSDFSHEVFSAMDGCLSCKACISECPVHVNIPQLRSRFLSAYYSRYFRPLRDHLILNSESTAIRMSRFPRLSHFLLDNLGSRTAIRLMGLRDLPFPALPSAWERLPSLYWDWQVTHVMPNDTVVIVSDPFTWTYSPGVLAAAVHVLEAMGFAVRITRPLPTGKAAHVKGFLADFRRQADRFISTLNSISERGLPMVVIEPSTASLFADEYRDCIPLHTHPIPIARFIAEHLSRLPNTKQTESTPVTVLPHCMERHGPLSTHSAWTAIFNRVGIPLVIPAVGCCGMAGVYGHENHHYTDSAGIFELSWKPVLDSSPQATASGFSCKCQIKRELNRTVDHPLEVLARAF